MLYMLSVLCPGSSLLNSQPPRLGWGHSKENQFAYYDYIGEKKLKSYKEPLGQKSSDLCFFKSESAHTQHVGRVFCQRESFLPKT
jgi:hypothetical protein